MKKPLKHFLLGTGAVVGVTAVVGLLLPRRYKVERSIDINATATAIYEKAGNLRNWPEWTVWSERDANMQQEFSENTTEAGAYYRWASPTQGNGQLTLTSVVPEKHLIYSLEFEGFSIVSTGKIILTEDPVTNITTVSWSDEGDLGINPFVRYMGLMVDKMLGPDFQQGLENLKELIEDN